MPTVEDQARWEQAQTDYTFRRPAAAVANAVGIPTTSDEAISMAAGPRHTLYQMIMAGRGALEVAPPADDPTVPNGGRNPLATPENTVPGALAEAPNAPNPSRFPGAGPVDEPITPALHEIMSKKVPADWAPLADESTDIWRVRNGFPTQAELQAKIAAFSAQESGDLQPLGAEPPVRKPNQDIDLRPRDLTPEELRRAQYFLPEASPPWYDAKYWAEDLRSPQAIQIMADNADAYDLNEWFIKPGVNQAGEPVPGVTVRQAVDEAEDAFRSGLVQAGQPGMGNYPPEPPRPPSPEPNVGRPGVQVTLEDAEKILAAEDARIAAEAKPPLRILRSPITEMNAAELGVSPDEMHDMAQRYKAKVDARNAPREAAEEAAFNAMSPQERDAEFNRRLDAMGFNDWKAAEEAAASVPRATRLKNMFRGAASEFLDSVPVLDAIVTPALAAGALANLEVQSATPEGTLRDISFRLGQGPLEMSQVGASADYLRHNPAAARQLYQEGVLSTDAFMTIMDTAMEPGPSLEPMRQAMLRIGG